MTGRLGSVLPGGFFWKVGWRELCLRHEAQATRLLDNHSVLIFHLDFERRNTVWGLAVLSRPESRWEIAGQRVVKIMA